MWSPPVHRTFDFIVWNDLIRKRNCAADCVLIQIVFRPRFIGEVQEWSSSDEVHQTFKEFRNEVQEWNQLHKRRSWRFKLVGWCSLNEDVSWGFNMFFQQVKAGSNIHKWHYGVQHPSDFVVRRPESFKLKLLQRLMTLDGVCWSRMRRVTLSVDTCRGNSIKAINKPIEIDKTKELFLVTFSARFGGDARRTC